MTAAPPQPPYDAPPPPPLPAPSSNTPSPQLFASTANAHLRRLRAAHDRHLASGADAALSGTLSSARAIRDAAVVHAAAADILALDPATDPASRADGSEQTAAAPRAYLSGLQRRLAGALAAGDYTALAALAASGRAVLDGLMAPEGSLFDAVDPVAPVAPAATASAATRGRGAGGPGDPRFSDAGDFDDDDDDVPPTPSVGAGRAAAHTVAPAAVAAAAGKRRRFCGLSLDGLSRRDRLVLWLYGLMVLAAVAAVTAVTVDFAQQQINPGSFIRSVVSPDGLPAPVVTVCLSQTGVPFSRLQLFNFTDATGAVFRGADPFGPQTERVSESFARVVERFWDNPDEEDCDNVVGDFYPFPLATLNDIVNGTRATRCRPCYRVGSRRPALSGSTDFQNASSLSFYTDNYFLQCAKSVGGLNEDSLDFLHDQLLEKAKAMEDLEVLSTDDGQPAVSELPRAAFEAVTSEQACNIFYFSFFPRALERTDSAVDVRYAYNGTAWREVGPGPYFRTVKESIGFLPEESLQMFVETNRTAQAGRLSPGRDMVLIGPNTQTLATIRPVIVYGNERYDVASSTSNFVQSNVTPIFGYWLIYKIFYNFNRFVTDEYYRESTYPVSQWLVDFTGYASLFTGASLFSLLLLPLLRAMRRRDRDRLLRRRPEAYVWAKHRRRLRPSGPDTIAGDLNEDDPGARTSSVMLPGYNV